MEDNRTLNLNKRAYFSALLVLLVLIGIVFTIKLTNLQTNKKAKADFDISRSFNVEGRDASGSPKPVTCQGTTCQTEADTVHIRFNQTDTQELLNTLP